MPNYETMFILRPDLPEAQAREAVDRVRRLIEGMNGAVLDVQEWGVRELAYPIARHSRGSYVVVQYAARPDVVKELERTLKIADDVLRFISVRLREKAARPRRAASTGAAVEAETAPAVSSADEGN